MSGGRVYFLEEYYSDDIVMADSFLRRIFSLGYVPRWLILVTDTVLCVLSYLIAFEFSVRYYYNAFVPSPEFNLVSFGIVLVLQVVWFLIFKTYAGIIRYSTFIDAIKLLYAVLSDVISVFVLDYILSLFGIECFLHLTLICYAAMAFIVLFVVRLFVKSAYDFLMSREKSVTPVVIYGTKAAGVAIAQMIIASDSSQYRVVGFVDNKHNSDKLILGLPIFSISNPNKMFRAFERKSVRTVIVSPLKMIELDMTKDLDIFIDRGIKVLVMPELDRLKRDRERNKEVNVDRNLHNIQIEDLLNRKPIVVDKSVVRDSVNGKVVMVTGAAGSIGGEIVRQLSVLKPSRVVLLDNAETPLHNIKLEVMERWPKMSYDFVIADVRNRDAIERVMRDKCPDMVFHAAAYKHVPMMEAHPSECVMTNVMGSRNVVDMAVRYGVKSFVMVSTDKAVNPTNVMGCSKRLAEIYVQSYFKKMAQTDKDVTQIMTTRFGNVLGSNGSVIPLFKKQIAEGGPITVTHPDIMRYFMTIPEACQLVLEAGTIGTGGNIYIFDMGTPVKIVNLAEKMIHLSGLVPGEDVKIVYTGLRPGEKLYEELLNSEEHVKSSVNDKIMVAATQEYDYDEVLPKIDELIEYAKRFDNAEVVKAMKAIVPEYKSQNSVYQAFDK